MYTDSFYNFECSNIFVNLRLQIIIDWGVGGLNISSSVWEEKENSIATLPNLTGAAMLCINV